jgi:hypothetical protein
MPGEEILTHGLITAAIHALEKLRRVRFWRFKIFGRNSEIRISFTALLRISDGGRYTLVRNFHRPELFGPFGGVYKFYDSARPRLDELLFRPQDFGKTDDMHNDLRGFLPRKNLSKLLKWFEQRDDRESGTECVLRELREELNEVSINDLSPPPTLQVRKIRRVEEGPERVPGRGYLQFRIFEIYEVIPNTSACFAFLETLRERSKTSNDLMLADSSDVVCGRCDDGRVIGNHVCYLIGKKRTRPEAPHFTKR